MNKTRFIVLGGLIAIFCFTGFCFSGLAIGAEEACITCHKKVSPGLVLDWESSRHSKEGVTCSVCHGENHTNARDFKKAILPDEHVCAQCHEKQFNQFMKGKHHFAWKALNALPITHVEPDELMEGGKGCGGCHNVGVKTKAERMDLHKRGYRYQNNACDECHTRHSFSKKEALDPRTCQRCHMGYDHPQWETWESSKHGTRYLIKEKGELPKNAQAPTCQFCHMPNGNHDNKTAWGFIGVRLPLPKDKQWAADRVTILKALGVLNPVTGKPTARLDVIKSVDMVRLTDAAWKTQREKMIKTCSRCHSESYAKRQLAYGDSMLRKADRLMAEGINIVAGLYRDGIIKKPKNYAFAYPDFLYFMRTGGGNMEHMSHIDQVLFQMYMKHRMRTYQGIFHLNPDYAYWYGWAMMTKDLGEIKELAKTMRATAKIEK